MYHTSRHEREAGQGLVEYALILIGVALVVILGLTVFGERLQGVYDCITNTVIALEPTDAGSVIGFELVDPGTNESLGNVPCIGSLASGTYSINALTLSHNTKSVYFEMTGPISQTRTENIVPYSLFGDTDGDYAGSNFPPGKYTLTATPYTGVSGGGTAGRPFKMTFYVE
jgi:Flp pilus assembly pilin Flp